MKHIVLFFIFSIALNTASFAQNDAKALTVLSKASESYNKAGGVKAGFNLKVLDYGGKVSENISGTIRLKGSKFKLETNEMTTWFDGKNQWVYLTNNNEVNLSSPSQEDLLMINPVNVFQLYEHGYNCKWIGEKQEAGRSVLKVSLTPKNKQETLQMIVVSFDKTNFRPVAIIITNKDKSGSRISIPSYLTGQKLADTLFVFQQKSYPNTEVIDLR
ncbi:MAG: LolA-like putative outer membrane lipoprotein chaperone [Bacteroidales bacterium]|nr:LolA-like putative outer membrane lipoprotein chaperone [Bacteroidales bacterium]